MDNQLTLGRVHIVEWLNAGDDDTGQKLFAELQPMGTASQPKLASGVSVLQDEWQPGNDQYNGLCFGCEDLIRPSLEIAKAAPNACRRHNPSANLVADGDDFSHPTRFRKLAYRGHENVLLPAGRGVGLALEQVGQPQCDALHEHRCITWYRGPHDAWDRFGLLNCGPRCRALGAMPLDAARHLTVVASTSRRNIDCRTIADQCLRIPAFPAASPPQHERQHDSYVAFITRTTGSSPI